MREIKFRAWNPNEDVMRYSQDFYNLRDFFGWVCLNDLQDKFTVMQYIELKGKNGKEIYEGDIFPYEGHNLIVKYELGGFVGNWFGLNEFIFLPDFANYEYDLEVIGNVYSNPELLETK